MTKSEQLRFDAIRDLIKDATDDNYEVLMTKEDLVLRIVELRYLGKTARWLDTIDGWVRMIEHTPDDINWAFHQGAIYANYAK